MYVYMYVYGYCWALSVYVYVYVKQAKLAYKQNEKQKHYVASKLARSVGLLVSGIPYSKI